MKLTNEVGLSRHCVILYTIIYTPTMYIEKGGVAESVSEGSDAVSGSLLMGPQH